MDQQLVDERIKSIRVRFLAALPKFVSDTSERWRRLRHNGWNIAEANELQVFAHRLAGSGATFGFPEISRTANLLDESLQAALALPHPPPDQLVRLEQQVNDLISTMRKSTHDTASPAPAAAVGSVQSGESKLVLLVDDDELMRARIPVVLEAAGYDVISAASPEAAVALLREHIPDVVLLDLMYPDQGRPAFDAIQVIREQTGMRIPVAIISGRADFSSRLEAVRSGADSYIAKPIEQQHLLKVVGELTSHRVSGLRCLVIDDDALLAEQLVTWMRGAGMTAESVNDPRDSWLKVREFKPDVIVLDYNMPECDGVELATMLRQDDLTALLPIVFLTANTNTHVRRNAMAAGADDFLTKPVTRETLLSSIAVRARQGKRMQQQVREVSQQGPQQAGLSRHFFYSELERALDEADEGTIRAALVLMGLNEAPEVLKTYGAPGLANIHEQWHKRLALSSERKWALLGENTVAFLLPRETAHAHVERVKTLVNQLSAAPYRMDGRDIPSNLGAAIIHLGRSNSSLNAVLQQAEQLLSLAFAEPAGAIKEGYAGAGNEEATDATGQLPLDRLRAVYQPIATIDGTGAPVHAVLARVVDKDGNLMPTGRFMGVLEKRGWMPDLDAWVFRHVHNVLTEQISVETPLFLTVNVSLQALHSAVYLETVRTVLRHYPMRNENQCLIVVVTENAAITHRGAVDELNNILQASGGGLMLSAYGSTSQSIRVLDHLRPLFIRLDEPLTQRLESNSATAADEGLLAAALAANASVVASGIENARSLSALWAKGVRRFQGYFIQEPSAVLEGIG